MSLSLYLRVHEMFEKYYSLHDPTNDLILYMIDRSLLSCPEIIQETYGKQHQF